MTYSTQEMATELENAVGGGYDPAKLSTAAFRIYQNHGLEISAKLDRYLLVLIAMDEGPEFEMTELEFLAMLDEIKRCD